ncbi:hypothetical protein ABIB51_002956 [Arthrobacter sp. UYCu712]
MDGNHGPEDELRSVIGMCSRALEGFTLPESSAGLLEAWRRLDELGSALATLKTRLEVAVVLTRVPLSTSGLGTSPMASEAVDRLILAVNNVIALRET